MTGRYDLAADVYSFGIMLYELYEHTLPQWDQQVSFINLPNLTFDDQYFTKLEKCGRLASRLSRARLSSPPCLSAFEYCSN